MSSQWRAYFDLGTAAEACGQYMTATLLAALTEQPEATLAISGGSSPKPLFVYLSHAPIPWDRVHLFWVDERAVPPTDPQSNFKLADELLIQPGKLPLQNIHRVMAELTPEHAAARYVQDIKDVFRLAEGALPEFTLIHQGIGPDGHTASLFPGEPLLDDRQGIAAAVYVEKMKSHRVTLLPGVLLKSQHTVFLVNGEDKAEVLNEVLHGEYTPHQYPSQLLAREGRDVHWFCDEASASRLSQGD